MYFLNYTYTVRQSLILRLFAIAVTVTIANNMVGNNMVVALLLVPENHVIATVIGIKILQLMFAKPFPDSRQKVWRVVVLPVLLFQPFLDLF